MTADCEVEGEERELSYSQFCAECSRLVQISDGLGDGWRLAGRQSDLWLEVSHSLSVSGRAAVCQYEVHYSLSYRVPVLLCRVCWSSGELVDHDTVRREVLGETVSCHMVSMAPHPLTGLPWLQVHPCRTEAVTRQMRGTGGAEQCNYLVTFLSLYGQAVGLNLSTEYAANREQDEDG